VKTNVGTLPWTRGQQYLQRLYEFDGACWSWTKFGLVSIHALIFTNFIRPSLAT